MATANTKRKVSKSYSDLYNTPDIAIDALWKIISHKVSPNVTFFEPCNGKGKISAKMKSYGIDMMTNELFSEHGYSHFNEDYLNPNKDVAKKWNYDIIISNPPFKVAAEFVLEGFKYSKEQYHLLRINFLEGKDRYKSLLSKKHLKNVYIFTYRVSCTKGVTEEPQPNAVCYAWYRFDRDYVGQPQLHWIEE